MSASHELSARHSLPGSPPTTTAPDIRRIAVAALSPADSTRVLQPLANWLQQNGIAVQLDSADGGSHPAVGSPSPPAEPSQMTGAEFIVVEVLPGARAPLADRDRHLLVVAPFAGKPAWPAAEWLAWAHAIGVLDADLPGGDVLLAALREFVPGTPVVPIVGSEVWGMEKLWDALLLPRQDSPR